MRARSGASHGVSHRLSHATAAVTFRSNGDQRAHTIGGGSSRGSNHTQVVSLTLRPVAQIEAFDVGTLDVELKLATAILDLRDAVKAAAASAPRFELESAQIELRFVVTRDGHITLIARGERSEAVTHTLRLHIAGRPT